ncbi:hypothetical protein BGX26_001515 [Mortierella sp. AD094]|nr:hypothetical protein BGX26_001515 [Mortierella sp. AD094]
MAATQAECNTPKVPVFHIGTSSHNPVSTGFVYKYMEKYWQQAKITNVPRTSNDIRFDFYSGADFDTRYKKRFAEELKIAQQENQDKLRKTLARAHCPKTEQLLYD